MVAAIEALEKVLTEAVNNSKITNTIDKEISKALGLLVDLILLPFLPLLVYGIITLYMAIINFGKWWSDLVAFLKEHGILGLLKLAVEAVWKAVDEWIKNLIKWLFGGETKPLKMIESALKVVWGVIEGIINTILKFLFGEGVKIKSIDAALKVAFQNLPEIIGYVLGFIFGVAVKSTINVIGLTISLYKTIASILWSIVEFIFGMFTGKTQDTIDFGISLFKLDASNPIWKLVESVFSGGMGFLENLGVGFKAGLNVFEQGGVVPGSGPQIAIVHGGETITPAGKSAGGNTFNFYGLTADQLPEKVRSILRQEGSRYTL